MNRPRRIAVGALLACAAGAIGITTRAVAQGPATTNVRSTRAQREDVSITVYNQNFGLVREVRTIDGLSGRVALELRDVAAQIQPETVSIKSLDGAGSLRVLEQNYRYDLLSPQTLLAKYVGRKIKVYRYNEKLGKEDVVDAEVLSVANGTVLKIGGEVTFDYPGRLAFPEVPPNLIANPTLVWLLDSKQPKQKVEVTYLTGGMNWSADYVLTVGDDDATADLRGWVTLVNQSGAAYENARLQLVAGDVQRVSDRGGFAKQPAQLRDGAEDKEEKSFREESFFEYHLYTLERPTTVLENEQKQVTLLEAAGIKVTKRLLFFGQQYGYRSQDGELLANQKVGVFLDIQNEEKNHLGMPLPKGIVRVYKADKSGSKQFIGEDSIDHTPRDERVRIKMGEAFDVVGDRKQTDYKVFGDCSSESAWEISLRNHKDAAATVQDFEPVDGEWTILSSSQAAKKEDSTTFSFTTTIPARGSVKITYRVRVKWC
jgi:hypothetical protein